MPENNNFMTRVVLPDGTISAEDNRYERYLTSSIAKVLEEIEKYENEPEETKSEFISLSERRLMLSNFSKIYKIEKVNTIDHPDIFDFKIYFDPVDMYFEDRGSNINTLELNSTVDVKYIYYMLWKLGFIGFRTSRFYVHIKINRSSFNIKTVYEDPDKANLHDNGFNCWGGWRNQIIEEISNKNFMGVLNNIYVRQQQMVLSDQATSRPLLTSKLYHVKKKHIEFTNEEYREHLTTLLHLMKNSVRVVIYREDSQKSHMLLKSKDLAAGLVDRDLSGEIIFNPNRHLNVVVTLSTENMNNLQSMASSSLTDVNMILRDVDDIDDVRLIKEIIREQEE